MKTEKIKELLLKKSRDGKIPCPVARSIAREINVSSKEVGKIANELKIKIIDCELGCF